MNKKRKADPDVMAEIKALQKRQEELRGHIRLLEEQQRRRGTAAWIIEQSFEDTEARRLAFEIGNISARISELAASQLKRGRLLV